MENWLDPYKLTQAGNPELLPDEVILFRDKNCSIYLGDVKKYRNGSCTLTTLRLLWNNNKDRHALQIKHVNSVETKSGGLTGSPKLVLSLNGREVVIKTNPSGIPEISFVPPPHPGYIMLSFHTKHRDDFHKHLLRAMESKAWVQKVEEKRQFSTTRAGIGGILKESKQKQAKQSEQLTQAFEDLDSLMTHARQMVAIANKIAADVHNKSEMKEKSEYDNMLQDLGISSPVTKEMSGSEYHHQLARQLVDFLLKTLSKTGGMMSLIDVYCVYNRARGSQLVSPDDLLQACKLMNSLNMPLKFKTFSSGVMVVQLAQFNEQTMSENIAKLIQKHGPLSEVRISQLLNISLNLTSEQLKIALEMGVLMVDESYEDGVVYYENLFERFYHKNIMKQSIAKYLRNRKQKKVVDL